MAERGSGSIVVIGSWMAGIGHDFVGLYSASKAAEEQLARSWGRRIRSPRHSRERRLPGATRTPINDDASDILDRMTAGIPAGRPGTPQDIARTVSWVVSENAVYLHGAVLAIDGGITSTRSA